MVRWLETCFIAMLPIIGLFFLLPAKAGVYPQHGPQFGDIVEFLVAAEFLVVTAIIAKRRRSHKYLVPYGCCGGALITLMAIVGNDTLHCIIRESSFSKTSVLIACIVFTLLFGFVCGGVGRAVVKNMSPSVQEVADESNKEL